MWWLLACREREAPVDAVPRPPGETGATARGDSATATACGGPARRHAADPVAAARGLDVLRAPLGGPLFPRLALDALWLAWGTGPIRDPERRNEELRARYGLAASPWPDEPYPAGLRALDGTWATLDCLVCHADTVAGETVVGAGNSRVDLEALFDDLAALNSLGGALGLPQVTLPYTLEGRTGAPGATDAFGLGMELSASWLPAAPIETRYGFQQAPAWWAMAYADRVYSDGSGDVAGHRTMAAMLLGSAVSPAALRALDDDLADLRAAQLASEPPRWPFEPPDEDAVARGARIHEATCAGCHGSACGGDAAPRVVPVEEVGTDPLRAQRFGPAEAAWVNASWFGEDAPMTPTGGYLARPLVGVWATAPYLHDGAVPDLAALLAPDERPARWRRVGAGAADYDPERVGWRWAAAAPGEPGAYDTTVPGLSADGHLAGEGLTDDERRDLLAFLITL